MTNIFSVISKLLIDNIPKKKRQHPYLDNKVLLVPGKKVTKLKKSESIETMAHRLINSVKYVERCLGRTRNSHFLITTREVSITRKLFLY